jgi:glycosyltransferase involved in cell wall biosynthesis
MQAGSVPAKILFHRHTPWQSEIRCSTNILAKLFQRHGHRIAYMQGIVHPGNVATRRGQWRSWREGPRIVDGTLVFTPFSLVPYSRFWPLSTRTAAHRSFRSCQPSIATVLDEAGFGEPDVIWTANPGSGVLKDLFPSARLVFQVVDYYPAFSGPAITKIERDDYRRADRIFVIGDALRRYVVEECGADPARVSVLGQGVALERFAKDLSCPAELRNLRGPIGIWVGVLAKGDPELFETAARALAVRGGTLVLIGPEAPWAAQLSERIPNVLLLGARSPEEVAGFLVHSHIGLMLYDRQRADVYRGQNPLKLYEYCGAGLGIVSTPHEEYRYQSVPAEIVNETGDVAAAIDRVLATLQDRRRSALEFASVRSWEGVFDKARGDVEKLLAADGPG